VPGKGLAITADCTPRYCEADPMEGGKQAVAEAFRNLNSVGSRPLATTDCLNFGNPERPEVMGTFVGAIKGVGQACLELDMPIVSGNVSLYNETNGRAVQPSPGIGAIGLIDNLDRTARVGFGAEGHAIILLGVTQGLMGSSLYLREVLGREDGAPPPVDLAVERRNGEFVRALIQDGVITTCHDVSDGGVLVAVTEMAMASDIGCVVRSPEPKLPEHGFWFGEDQGRYLITVAGNGVDMVVRAGEAGVEALVLGQTGGDTLTVGNGSPISLRTIRDHHEGWLPGYMSGSA
jgi:phosphoribosylformylglycinamidine synthase